MSDKQIENETIVLAQTLTAETADAVPPQEKPAKPYVPQSLLTAETIVLVRSHITNVQTNTELAALMAERGFGPDKLAQGLALQNAAAAAYDRRQQAIGAQQTATAALALERDAVKTAYREFRAVAGLVLNTPAARAALGLNARVPMDTEKMMALARSAYTAALETPEYDSLLENAGYSPERLQLLLAQVDALYAPLAAAELAKTEARRAVQERDVAVKSMMKWHRHFKTVARFAVHGRPDLKPLVGL